jgi:hypothetical protein
MSYLLAAILPSFFFLFPCFIQAQFVKQKLPVPANQLDGIEKTK